MEARLDGFFRRLEAFGGFGGAQAFQLSQHEDGSIAVRQSVDRLFQHAAEFAGKMTGWLADGTVRYDETIVEGLDNAPQAFMDLLDGANTGKMLVRL